MKYRLIDAEKDHHGVSQLARVLGVSRQGYYAWARCGPSARATADAALTETIATIHRRSRFTYCAPRVHAELREDYGIRVGRKRVARLGVVTSIHTPLLYATIDIRSSRAVRVSMGVL